MATFAAGTPFLIDPSQRRETDRLLAEGLLETLLPGVAGPPGGAGRRQTRLVALALALSPRAVSRAVVSELAAAWIWCGGDPPDVIDVVVPPGRSLTRPSRPPLLAVHQRRLPPQDLTALEAGPVRIELTTPTRTLTDLLRLPPSGGLRGRIDALAAVPGVSAGGVATCLDRMPRARGVSRARAALVELLGAAPAGVASVDALAGDAVGVEDALHPPDGADHVVEVRGVGHLEGEA